MLERFKGLLIQLGVTVAMTLGGIYGAKAPLYEALDPSSDSYGFIAALYFLVLAFIAVASIFFGLYVGSEVNKRLGIDSSKAFTGRQKYYMLAVSIFLLAMLIFVV